MNRKLISWVSAVALASSVVVVPLSANAEGETVLYSNSFDGYATSSKTAGGIVFAAQAGGDYSSVEGNDDWSWIFDSPSSRTLDKLTAGFDGTGGDDTAAMMIIEKDDASDKYLSMYTNRFSTRAFDQITGFDQYTANDGEDLVIAFDMKLTPSTDTDQTDANKKAGIELGVTSLSSDSYTDWVKVKAVTSDGKTTVYVDDTAVATDVTGVISTITPKKNDNSTKMGSGIYPETSIDNLVIFSAADGANAEIPTAETQPDDYTPATEAPTAAPGAEIDNTVTYDFETDDTTLTPTTQKDYTTATVVDGTYDGNTTKVMQVAQTSTKNNSCGYAMFDISSITGGKSHVIVDYDAYIVTGGRIGYYLVDTTEGITSTKDGVDSIFSQGFMGSSISKANADAWIHTSIDVNLADGSGSYTVTAADGTEIISSGSITTTATTVASLQMVSWSANTSYIDNLVIQTGGSMAAPTLIPTEEPGTAEGSDVDIATEAGAAETLATFSTDTVYDGEATEVINHASAYKAKVDTSVAAYTDKARGNSIYAAYDVLLTPESSVSVTFYGDSGKAQSSTLNMSADATGLVTVSATTDKGTTTASDTLAHDTWYRVLFEAPQSGDSTTTNTGSLTATIYRIDGTDSTKVTEVAASLTGLSSRGLASKGVTAFGVSSVTGDVYLDNGVTFRAAQGTSLIEAVPTEVPTEEPGTAEGSYIDLAAAADASETLATFAPSFESASEKIVNHSAAYKAAQTDATAIAAYSTSARGYSVYAAYDVLLTPSSDISVKFYGDSGKAEASTITMTADEYGAVTLSAKTGSSDSAVTTAADTIAHDTWYRVLIEAPQSGDSTTTNTGNLTVTVYRINGTDPTQVTEVAASLTGLSSRGLASKGVTSFGVSSVTGDVYLDNGVTFRAAQGTSYIEDVWTQYTAEYDENGALKSVTSTVVDDPSSITTDDNTNTAKVFIWNQNYVPYKAATAAE